VIKPLIAGNWKMNGLRDAIAEAVAISKSVEKDKPRCDVLLCPPATLLPVLHEEIPNSVVALGGQDCHAEAAGANTGDISAEMLKDAGASSVIIGHSERRGDHRETSTAVCSKVLAAHRAGLTAIVCIGETAGERRAGLTTSVVMRQLEASLPESGTAGSVIVAYEPVWAIGTGLTPSSDDIAGIHASIRETLKARFRDGDQFRILYGGSVKAKNAAELMAVDNVNGALVGGASLKAKDFLGIINYYKVG